MYLTEKLVKPKYFPKLDVLSY